MDSNKLDRMLTTSEAAERFDVEASTLRREAKAGRVPGVQKILKRWAFDPVVMEEAGWEPPDGSGSAATRTNEAGEPVFRWKIWATKEQIEKLRSEGFDIENPRKKARARRERKEKEEAEVEEADNQLDLFSNFE